MYRDSPQWLRMMDYCNGVQSFINYALSNPRNINRGDIRCPCKRYKNRNFLDLDVVMMHLLQKKIHEEMSVLVCTRRTICSSHYYGRKDGWVNF
jgi:hypothetical protein